MFNGLSFNYNNNNNNNKLYDELSLLSHDSMILLLFSLAANSFTTRSDDS